MKNRTLKYPPEFKREVCETALSQTIRKAADLYGVNKETVTRWLKTYKKMPVTVTPRDTVKTDDGVLYIYFDVVASTVRSGKNYNLYQFSIANGSGSFRSMGFAASKDNDNICLFLDYVLTTVKELKKFRVKEIRTNIYYLSQKGNYTIYKRTIEEKFGVELKITKNRTAGSEDLKIELKGRADKEKIITEAYKKLISGQEAEKLSDGILMPPLFVDDFIKDSENIMSFSNYWNVLNLPEKQSGILTEVIRQIEKMADEARIEFEFDKAMDFYHRIYLTAADKVSNAEVRTGAMIKQAEIHYHLDNIETSKELLLDCARLSERHNCMTKAAKARYYLGMIDYLLSEKKSAEHNFVMAIANYEKAGESPSSFDYMQVRVRKVINAGLLKKAVAMTDDFIRKTSAEKITSATAKAWGLKGNALYMNGDFKGTEKCYLKQLKIAEEIRDYNEMSVSLTGLVTLYVYLNSKTYKELRSLLKKIRDISILTKKKTYAAESNFILGMYFYKKKEYKKAVHHLEISLSGHKMLKHSYKYISNQYYLGRSLFLDQKYIKSAKVFKSLLLSCKSDVNSGYLLQTLNQLGLIYFSRKNYRKAILWFNKIRKSKSGADHEYFTANAFMHLGIIYDTDKSRPKTALNYFLKSKKYFERYKKVNPDYDISELLDFVNKEIKAKI